jgi:hypothetical protein
MKEEIDMNLPNFIHAALKFPKSKTGLDNAKRDIKNEKIAEDNLQKEFTAMLNAMDGMGTGTARFVIERKLPDNIGELYRIGGLENKGRYYLAKIIGNDGRVVNQLLVDKQNATIHFLKTPLKRMS